MNVHWNSVAVVYSGGPVGGSASASGGAVRSVRLAYGKYLSYGCIRLQPQRPIRGRKCDDHGLS